MVPGDVLSSQAVLTSCLILFIFFARLIAFLYLIFPSRLSVSAAQSLGPQGISRPWQQGVIQRKITLDTVNPNRRELRQDDGDH